MVSLRPGTRALAARLGPLLELGIDPAEVSAETLRRIRVMTGATASLLAIALGSAVQYAAHGVPEGALALSVTVVLGAANLGLLRRTRRTALAAHLGLCILTGMIGTATALTGGFEQPGFGWLLLVPVAAAVTTDLRGALAWLGVSLSILFGFYLLSRAGIVFESRIPQVFLTQQALFDRASAMLGLAAIAVSFVVGQRRAERTLGQANEELRDETRLVRLLTHGAVAANEALSLEEALRSCVAGICSAMSWAGGQAYLRNDGDVLEACDARAGEEATTLTPLFELARQTRYEVGKGLPGRVLASGRAECIRDLRAMTGGGERERARRSMARRVGVVAALAAPIPVNGRVQGVIEFASREPLPQGDRVLEVLTLLGVQLGRVAERQLLQDRLRQAQKIEAIGQLAAGLAHEINNPMTYVRANLNLLRTEWDALRKDLETGAPWEDRFEECGELLGECAEGVDRTVTIVRDVKEFSHAGNTRWEWVDLNDVLDGAVRVASPQAPPGSEIRSDLGEVPRVRGSSAQLRQVFLNLVVNALQAIDAGGSIQLSTHTRTGFAVVRVRDDGAGIDPSARDRLFEPFFTTKPVGEGTGLGLYVSYEIVRNHGGEIRVESAPGAGACFEVCLPLEESGKTASA